MSGYGYNYTNQNNNRYHHDYYHDDAPPEEYDESSSSPYHPHPNPHTYGYHHDPYSNVISSTTTEGYPLDNVGMYEDYYGRGRSSRSDTSAADGGGHGNKNYSTSRDPNGFLDTADNDLVAGGEEDEEEEDILFQQQQQHHQHQQQQQQQQQQGEGSSVSDAVDNNDGDDDDVDDVDFDDPRIANLPRILMMGPRRAGKTSIQVSEYGCDLLWNKISFMLLTQSNSLSISLSLSLSFSLSLSRYSASYSIKCHHTKHSFVLKPLKILNVPW
jgi:hypothetical protein